MKPKGGSHLCLKYNTRTANNHSNTGGRMGERSPKFTLTKLRIPTVCAITQPEETQQRERRKQTLQSRVGIVLELLRLLKLSMQCWNFLLIRASSSQLHSAYGSPIHLHRYSGSFEDVLRLFAAKYAKKEKKKKSLNLSNGGSVAEPQRWLTGAVRTTHKPQDRSRLVGKV